MFENFSDKGDERWEIYGWALREVMMKQGGMSPCDAPLRHKMIYEAYMQMQPDAPVPAQAIESLTLLQNINLQLSPTINDIGAINADADEENNNKFYSLPNGEENEM